MVRQQYSGTVGCDASYCDTATYTETDTHTHSHTHTHIHTDTATDTHTATAFSLSKCTCRDPFVRSYLNKLSAAKPVVFTGDLNVGHLNLDIHNPWAKHIVQQAGLTPQERASMSSLLDTNFIDAFRFLYPGEGSELRCCGAQRLYIRCRHLFRTPFHPLQLDARGQFTYWSQRTFARPVNKGIRLDYFICSTDMFPPTSDCADGSSKKGGSSSRQSDGAASGEAEAEMGDAEGGPLGCGPSGEPERDVQATPMPLIGIPSPGVYDSYIIHSETVGCSDHCPVVLVVKL